MQKKKQREDKGRSEKVKQQTRTKTNKKIVPEGQTRDGDLIDFTRPGSGGRLIIPAIPNGDGYLIRWTKQHREGGSLINISADPQSGAGDFDVFSSN